MRVTDSQAFDTMRRQITEARSNTMKAQEQASSGLKVSKPSDDPVAAAAARRQNAFKASAQSASTNADVANQQLSATDDALADATDSLSDAKAIAVSGSNATLNDENLRALAIEVRRIRETMVNTANTNVNGKYLFAGYRDQTPPFDANGTFVGDASTKEIETIPGVRQKASVSGPAVFGDAGNDVFQVLDTLANDLESGNIDGVRGAFKNLDDSSDRVLSVRAQVGAMVNTATMARNVSDRHVLNATTEISRLTEVDEFEAATNLVKARSALDAAVAVAQQIPVGGLIQQAR